MARPTYRCRVITLDKTKLGESDIIVTALKEDGSLLRAVAKGARKPTNPFAARLEIFSVCDCLIAQGKNLDVFSEARTVQPNMHIRQDYDLSSVSYPIVQALAKTCHEGLEAPRVFQMTQTALGKIDSSSPGDALAVSTACLLKLNALLGFRPQFMRCTQCGENLDIANESGHVSFSYPDGGYVCRNCAGSFDVVKIDSPTLAWANTLMMSTFDEITDMHILPSVSFAVMRLVHNWFRVNLGLNLKSLNALFAYSDM